MALALALALAVRMRRPRSSDQIFPRVATRLIRACLTLSCKSRRRRKDARPPLRPLSCTIALSRPLALVVVFPAVPVADVTVA